MSDVKELEINSTVYNIVGKAVIDENNASTPVKTWTGTSSDLPVSPSADTLYYVTDTKQILLGSTILSDGLKKTYDLFDFKWSDHEITDQSWLQADTFSWQDGTVYSDAYNHLNNDVVVKYAWLTFLNSDCYTLSATPSVGDTLYYPGSSTEGGYKIVGVADDYSYITVEAPDGVPFGNATRDSGNDIIEGSTTETIGSYTIDYVLAADGHKIVLAENETTVANIYSETGVAWYYVLDTANTRFKLPRTKYGFNGYRDAVGNYISAGLPNITGQVNIFADGTQSETGSALTKDGSGNTGIAGASSNLRRVLHIDASRSSSIYGNSTTVQPPATQMYLYFYVGQFSQSATEQTAGLNASLFNNKVDLDSSWGFPSTTYDDLTLGASDSEYTATASGYISFNKAANGANQFISGILLNESGNAGVFNIRANIPNSGGSAGFILPVKSGDKFKILYNAGGTTNYFRFIYAQKTN